MNGDSGTPSLCTEDRETLLRLARRTLDECLGSRRTLEEYLDTGVLPDPSTSSPALLEPRATFVTLWRRDTGELRGCRGEIRARRALVESVMYMAVASAVDDPRFPPVTAPEVPGLRIEISVLAPLEPISVEEIEVGRHGLMIVKGGYSGLLLPQVPVSHGWGRDQFLVALCRKAGLVETAWKAPGAKLYGFETEEWAEAE
jgi:AmmeMemoRadiSam system protein A